MSSVATPDDDCNSTIAFDAVLEAEHRVIANRRGLQGRPGIMSSGACGSVPPPRAPAENCVYDSAGICLSGGGIRSAAFSLGALQSLFVHGLFDRLDYMSTVSGGGYTGASISAAMSIPGPFPFAVRGEIDDTVAVRHIRDFSNYLLPRGHRTLMKVIAVILRGLTANLVIITGPGLLLAGITAAYFPQHSMLSKGLLRLSPDDYSALIRWFGPALAVAAVLILFLAVWSLWPRHDEIRSPALTCARLLLWFLAAIAAISLQPLFVAAFYSAAMDEHAFVHRLSFGAVAGALSATATVITFFRQQIAAVLKKGSGARSSARIGTHAAIWAISPIIPIACYILFYVWPAAAIICDDISAPGACQYPLLLEWLRPGPLPFISSLLPIPPHLCLAAAAVLIGLIFIGLMFWFKPNSNSLHELYRDKLAKAFLFDPARRERPGDRRSDLCQRPIQLTGMLPQNAAGGPYHLINAAINLQASRHANRRGRDADFFLFSPQHVGSDATGYVSSRRAQELDRHIDLASAMAISGAAISSDMGKSMRALAPTLALLNLRLGYWIRNPRYMVGNPASFRAAANELRYNLGSRPQRAGKPRRYPELHQLWRRVSRRDLKFYLFEEMLGQLDETSPRVYLTDGGHIENLGLYQLLKRRCKAIIVVDAEQDPDMTFNALATAERYARIDLGIRINLPWEKITAVTKAAGRRNAKGKDLRPRNGPHCAIGVIHYPNGVDGWLLYIKSSFTGDEPDYVCSYKQRYPAFPHESTGDQFFSEEQFEAYRALGFHSTENFFDPGQCFAWSKAALPRNCAANDPDSVRREFVAAIP